MNDSIFRDKVDGCQITLESLPEPYQSRARHELIGEDTQLDLLRMGVTRSIEAIVASLEVNERVLILGNVIHNSLLKEGVDREELIEALEEIFTLLEGGSDEN